MEILDMDTLMAIAEESPFFDSVERAMRNCGQDKIADRVVKFQQDAGVKLDVELTGVPLDAEMPGPESAKLRKEYEDVSRNRMNGLLVDVDRHLPAELREGFTALCRKLGVEENRMPDGARAFTKPGPRM